VLQNHQDIISWD